MLASKYFILFYFIYLKKNFLPQLQQMGPYRRPNRFFHVHVKIHGKITCIWHRSDVFLLAHGGGVDYL